MTPSKTFPPIPGRITNTTTEELQWHPCRIRISGIMRSACGPHRVFDGRYPRFQPRIAEKIETSFETDQSADPSELFHAAVRHVPAFGDMEQSDILFEGGTDGVGVFMSDSGLFREPSGRYRGRRRARRPFQRRNAQKLR